MAMYNPSYPHLTATERLERFRASEDIIKLNRALAASQMPLASNRKRTPINYEVQLNSRHTNCLHNDCSQKSIKTALPKVVSKPATLSGALPNAVQKQVIVPKQSRKPAIQVQKVKPQAAALTAPKSRGNQFMPSTAVFASNPLQPAQQEKTEAILSEPADTFARRKFIALGSVDSSASSQNREQAKNTVSRFHEAASPLWTFMHSSIHRHVPSHSRYTY